MVAPGASFLSPRGKVLERGLPRFFRRLSEGVFDVEDLKARTHELADWIEESGRTYGFDPLQLTALGYSNGANIAASLYLLRPQSLGNAMLLRAMLPFEPEQKPVLVTKRILMSNGSQDPIIPMASAGRLAEIFKDAGAEVTFDLNTGGGHGLEQRDISNAATWYRGLLSAAYRF